MSTTSRVNGEVIEEGMPGDPRVVNYPEDAPTYKETGRLESGGGDPKKLTNDHGGADPSDLARVGVDLPRASSW